VATLFCESIDYDPISIPFDRSEFMHQKQRTALENTGTAPVIVSMIYGVPAQITSTGAVQTTARNLQPDDSDLTNIYQKFFGYRYTLTGDTTLNSDTDNVLTWATYHKSLQDAYEAHQKYAAGNTSIQDLVTFQSETFAYITTTGFSLTCNSLGTIQNIFIREFSIDVDYDTTGYADPLILHKWKMVVDELTLQPLAATFLDY
jgi:hypothetical protein